MMRENFAHQSVAKKTFFRFAAVYAKSSFGIVSAKENSRIVLTVYVVSLECANRHPNKKVNKK
jgi:hypothetical protein